MCFGNKSAKNIRIIVSCLFAASLLSVITAQAATVTLKNGDQISGELQQLSGDVLTFKSSVFGEVKIPWKEVQKLDAAEPVRVELKDGSIVKGRLAVDDDAVTVAESEAGQSQPLARKQVAAFNPPVIDPSVQYSGHLNLGGAFNRGNSDEDQLNLNGEFIARTPEERYTVSGEVNEAKSDGVKTTSNRRLLLQYDNFLDRKNYVYARARAESDEMADLNLRTSLGGGYGRQFLENDITKLSGEVGLNYVHEDYDVSPDQSFPTLSVGYKYDRKFLDKKLVFFNSVTLDANLDDTEDLLAHGRIGFRVPLAKNLNVSTQLNVDYDNQPADGAKKTDTALVFSLGYGF
jgi:putative salt-induced outer membrane protein YdiY